MKEQNDFEQDLTQITAKYSALLTGSEVFIGGVLHSWKVPLAGHFLSLNQLLILSRVSKITNSKFSTVQVSVVSSVLKSLTPMGKRLTPMLAILVQGILFSFGQMIFGVNRVGTAIGAVLLSIWAFVQPAIIYLLVFGFKIVETIQYYIEKYGGIINFNTNDILQILAYFVIFKCFIAIIIGFISFNHSNIKFEGYLINKINNHKITLASNLPISFKGKIRLLLKDLFQFWFISSLVLMLIFLFLTNEAWINIFLYLLRTISVGLLVFYILRFTSIDKLIFKFLKEDSLMGASFLSALKIVKGEKLPK